MEELIAKRYAQALLDVSTPEQKKLYVSILNSLSDAFSDEVISIIESPIIAIEQKSKLLLDSLGKNSDNNMQNFIKILAENKRLSLIPTINRIVNMENQKETNEYNGIILSKDVVAKASIISLEGTLKKYTGSKINLTYVKSDFDGLKVSVDDLGIEVNFSKERVKQQLIDFIKKSL
jgi:F-type H+-transporting ATPase subunit delta